MMKFFDVLVGLLSPHVGVDSISKAGLFLSMALYATLSNDRVNRSSLSDIEV